MAVFLVIHARYKDVQWGIFRDTEIIAEQTDASKNVSKKFIPLLDKLLKKNNLVFSDLSFIGAHQGPAPFTTLRVCLATVNGFSFATGIPLVGVNGLEALIDDYKQPGITVALLNAFSQELYYAIYDPSLESPALGYAPAEDLIKNLAERYSGTVTFLGNGAEMYHEQIKESFRDRAVVLEKDMVSLQSIGHRACDKWRLNDVHQQLMPIYLKSYSTPPHPTSRR